MVISLWIPAMHLQVLLPAPESRPTAVCTMTGIQILLVKNHTQRVYGVCHAMHMCMYIGMCHAMHNAVCRGRPLPSKIY